MLTSKIANSFPGQVKPMSTFLLSLQNEYGIRITSPLKGTCLSVNYTYIVSPQYDIQPVGLVPNKKVFH